MFSLSPEARATSEQRRSRPGHRQGRAECRQSRGWPCGLSGLRPAGGRAVQWSGALLESGPGQRRALACSVTGILTPAQGQGGMGAIRGNPEDLLGDLKLLY